MPLKLSRRRFLAGAGGVAGAAMLTAGRFRPARAQHAQTKLPIPALIDGANGEPVNLKIRRGEWSFMPGVKTPTLGINQNYLGPTIRARRGGELNLHYHNTLAEGVAMHGHGLHVPGEVDGGPQREIAPGERWQPALAIAQPAATCWYHAHTHGSTGAQVYRGLAGLLIIDDADADAMQLPRRYGVDDLPVIIQDRTFDARGRLAYSLSEAGQDGWLGDTVVINGAIAPVAKVPAGKVRLRLLNAANARFYIIGFADNRVFYKIAGDGGLLPAPAPMRQLEMGPGERCEIIVDLSDGQSAGLLTLFEDAFDDDDDDDDEEGFFDSLLEFFERPEPLSGTPSLTLEVDKTLAPHTAPLPKKLATLTGPKESEIIRARDFMLEMEDVGDASLGHAAMDMTINGAAMDMQVINERVTAGAWERWRIRSNLGEHPFHVHGCSFLIERIGGEAVPPELHGWKDTVTLDDDGWSEIVVRFEHPATAQFPYMYHCHILEHEDRGMMGQFTVSQR